ncbi:hypothetical protein ACFP2T_35900 [Plantactinospora solaniradicis]|uniref:Sigma-70 family RNA polymerase sigma factor n=1 Tax=Plantactinospora solaniradicis TaxID=1723736 RepID=A0ABW1KIX7_9ACTN
MTNDEAAGYLGLCRKAAWIATKGTNADVEDVTQELFLWVLETKAIESPSYKGLASLLVKEARSYIADQRNQASPLGWSPEPWTTDEIRAALRAGYRELPPQLSEALASDRMPQGYRDVLEATYGRGEMPPRGSALRRRMYRAVDRLQEVVNWPLAGIPGGVVDIHDLTDTEDGWLSTAADRGTEQRRELSARGALLGRVALASS